MKKVQPYVARPARSAGFTILELMIAVAVLGILVGIGVPSFNGIIRQNRLATQANDLLTATAITRNEAVKRGAPVTLCPVAPAPANPDACSGVAAWGLGWIVFVDEANPGVRDANELIIQRWAPAAAQNVNIVNTSDPALTSITYLGSGATTLPTGAITEFTIRGVQCTNPNGLRTININAAGRARVTRADC